MSTNEEIALKLFHEWCEQTYPDPDAKDDAFVAGFNAGRAASDAEVARLRELLASVPDLVRSAANGDVGDFRALDRIEAALASYDAGKLGNVHK